MNLVEKPASDHMGVRLKKIVVAQMAKMDSADLIVQEAV